MEGPTAARATVPRVDVDGQPFWAWLDAEVVPRYGSLNDLTRALAEQAAVRAESLQRQIMRLRARPTIEFFALDRLCVLLGEHISRFCDLSRFEGLS